MVRRVSHDESAVGFVVGSSPGETQRLPRHDYKSPRRGKHLSWLPVRLLPAGTGFYAGQLVATASALSRRGLDSHVEWESNATEFTEP